MRITKRQLRRIIKEEYDAYSIENIRERGQANEMADEVHDIMNSMGPGALSGKEAYDMIWDAVGSEDPGRFWWEMLSPDGHLSDAIIGLRNTADEEYDPDIPVKEAKLSKRHLRRIIREEKSKLLSEGYHEMYASDDELRELGEAIESLVHWTMETNVLMDRMAERYGELAAQTTTARRVANDVEALSDGYDQALDNMLRFR